MAIEGTIAFFAVHDLMHSRDQLDTVLAGLFNATLIFMHHNTYHVDWHHIEVMRLANKSCDSHMLSLQTQAVYAPKPYQTKQ